MDDRRYPGITLKKRLAEAGLLKRFEDVARAGDCGPDWIFGHWLKQEPHWLLAVYEAVEELP